MQRIEEGLSLETALPLFDLHGTDAVEVFDTQRSGHWGVDPYRYRKGAV